MLRMTALLLLALASPQTPAPTGLIVGRVLDQTDGKPISGAVVEMVSDSSAWPAAAPAFPGRRQMTDALGRFVFRDLPGGQYFVRVTAGGGGFSPNGFIQNGFGFPIGRYLEGGYGQRRPGGAVQPLLLAEGQGIPDLVVQLWRGAALNGTVLDDTGEPVVDAVVGAVRVSSDGRLTNGPTARTDDRGMYRVSALAPGRYIVFVPQTTTSMSAESADDLMRRVAEVTAGKSGAAAAASADLTGIRVGSTIVKTASTGLIDGNIMPRQIGDATFVFQTTFYPAAVSLGSAATIEVAAGDDRLGVDVVVQPVRAVPVSGTLSSAGAPASGVRLRLVPGGSSDSSLFEAAVTQTDALGRFTFPLVPIGNYVLGRVNDRSSGSAVGPGAWLSESIGVPVEGVSNLALTLKPGLVVRGQLEFAGTAQPPSNADLLKMLIGVRAVSPRARSDMFGGGPESVSFFPGGFGTSGIPPGRYVFRAGFVPPGSPWRVQSVMIGGRDMNDLPFDVTDDISNVRVIFTDRPAAVTGRVTSSEPGDGGIAVLLFPTDRALWPDARALTRRVRIARTAVSGEFNIADVPPGDYFVIAMLDTDTGDWPDLSFLTKAFPQAQALKIGAGDRPSVSLTVKKIQ